MGFKWDPQFLDVQVNDIVSWQWNALGFVNRISYTILQTADADSTSYDGSGFYAGTASADGKI